MSEREELGELTGDWYLTDRILEARYRKVVVDDAMVERAAIAACNHDPALKRWEEFGERSPLNPDEWWVHPDIGRNWWRDIARAALLAALSHERKP
jgi:hypothetical protein